MTRSLAATLLALSCVSGCATLRVRQDPEGLRAELLRLAQRPVKSPPPAPSGTLRVLEWNFIGPFPVAASSGNRVAEGEWEEFLVSQGATLTTGLNCYARELGRFMHLRGGTRPDDLFMRHVAGRCGVVGDLPGSQFERWNTTDCAIAADRHKRIEQGLWVHMIENRAAGADATSGVSANCSDGSWSIYIATNHPGVKLASTTLFNGGENGLKLEGELVRPFGDLNTWATVGDFGAVPCTRDPSVRAPRFRFRCPIAPGSAATTIDMRGDVEGKEFSEAVLTLVITSAEAPLAYTRRIPAAAGNEGRPAQRFAVELNRVRARAQLPPLAVEEDESTFADALVAQLVAVHTAEEERLIDRGLLAGTEVRRPIFSATLFSGTVIGDDVAWQVDVLMNQPDERAVLLDRYVTSLALGTAKDGGNTRLRVIFYRAPPKGSTLDATKELITRLFAERARLGLAEDKWMTFPSDPSEFVVGRLAEGRTPQELQHELVLRGANDTGRRATATHTFVGNLASVRFSEALLSGEPNYVAVVVAPWTPPDSTRGGFLVFFIWVPLGK